MHEVALLCTRWPQERGGNWFVAATSQVNWLCRILYIVCVCTTFVSNWTALPSG